MQVVFVYAKYRGVEQMVARRAHNPKVAGSSPAPATEEPNLFDSAFFIPPQVQSGTPLDDRLSMCCRAIPSPSWGPPRLVQE